jgi:hypothetical protein
MKGIVALIWEILTSPVVVVLVLVPAAASAAAVLPAADGWTLEATGVGTFVVKGSGPGLYLQLRPEGGGDAEGIDSAPDVYEIECDLGLLYWDDEAGELFYWKSDDGGYSIWVWRPGGERALVAWSWTRPAYTAAGVAGGPRPILLPMHDEDE